MPRPRNTYRLDPAADPDTARAYIQEHDDRAVQVDGLSLTALKRLHEQDLALRGKTLLFGGACSHDELVNAIVDMEYPDTQAARDIWYRHTQMPAMGQE